MSVVHIVSCLRKRKPRTRKRRDEDFLSKLPDDILDHIISFLPTKDLVRTSVLSTSWRELWTFFPVIDIDLDRNDLRDGFLGLMDWEMLNPSSVRIRKFRLDLASTPSYRCKQPINASDILLWVDKVIEHKVQELDLDLPLQTFGSLPDRLFSSNSLTKLELEMDCELTIPDSVCLPRLKILRLSGLKFSCVRSTEKLFSSCPVLEDLSLRVRNWGRISSIVIYIPSLQTLSIYYHPFEELPDTKIMISSPNLVSFKCDSDDSMDLVLCNQSSLEDASIDVLYEEASVQRIVNLFHGIQDIKSLALFSYTLKALSFDKDLHNILPSFDNMKCLRVVCPCNECCSRALIEILRKTPHLHSLILEPEIGEPDVFTQEDGILNVIPQCFKTTLKRIEFDWFAGYRCEVRHLKHFLGNATLLEKMFIKYSGDLSADRREEIRNELELSRAASTNCEIVFSDWY